MTATMTVGSVAVFSKGSGLSKSDLATDGAHPCIHYGELFTQYGAVIGIVRSRTNQDLAVRSEAGDVLMPTSDVTPRGLAKASAILRSGVGLGGDILVIRPDRAKIDPRFLAYAIRHDANQVLGLVRGSTVYHLYAADMRHFELPSLPIAEQARAADALKDADDLIDTLERLIAKKRAIKQGMMQELLTGKTRLPGFTEPWRDVLLGDHVSYLRTVALSRAQLDNQSPVRYVHYGDIHTRSDAKLNAASEPMPRANAALLGNAGRLQVGDVVFADASEDPDGVGKSVEITAVPSEGVVPGLHTIAARFDQKVLTNGFKAYLQFIPAFRQALLRLAAGTKVLATTRSFISSVSIYLPGVDEQRAIAVVLDDVNAEIAQLEASLIKARDMKLGMMQELLTGRTRLPVKEAVA